MTAFLRGNICLPSREFNCGRQFMRPGHPKFMIFLRLDFTRFPERIKFRVASWLFRIIYSDQRYMFKWWWMGELVSITWCQGTIFLSTVMRNVVRALWRDVIGCLDFVVSRRFRTWVSRSPDICRIHRYLWILQIFVESWGPSSPGLAWIWE